MFSGIVEEMAEIIAIERYKRKYRLRFKVFVFQRIKNRSKHCA